MVTSSIEAEYNEIQIDGWSKTFQNLRERSEQQSREKKFTLNESIKEENRRRNRYRDVNPYDHSRIVLQRGNAGYINANLVKCDRANRKYILTQGPLASTVGHFWLAIWENNSKAILMLNKLYEKEQPKCHMYWPEKIGTEHKFDLTDVGLIIEYLRCDKFTNFCKRTFRLTDTESTKSREVIQFHYTTWPDFGIPSSPVEFLQFLLQVRDSGALNPDVGPAVVHCSAGIGRSGTFCLVDCCLVLIDKEGENKVSVMDVLLELRQYRMGLIQTADQLYFSYQAIIEGMKHLNDPNFIANNRIPINSYDETIENNDDEDVPPPLPQRIESKRQPIPFSASAHEFRDFETKQNTENLERNQRLTRDRPLPPLPSRDQSLEKVGEVSNDDDDDEDDVIESDSSINDGDEDDNNQKSINEKMNDSSDNSNDEQISSVRNGDIFDADATLPPSPSKSRQLENGLNSIGSPESLDKEGSTEIRRRKRYERQIAISEKVQEIKRKQKAQEDDAANAPAKKRRHEQCRPDVNKSN